MRLLIRLALGLAVTLGVAGITRAGGGPDLDPIHAAVDVCGTSDSVASGMDPALVAFAGFADCKALCGKAEGVCKKLQKRRASCYLHHFKSQEIWTTRNCKVAYSIPAEVKQCELQNKQIFGGQIKQAQEGFNDQLSECESWGDTCRVGCEPT